MKKSTSGSKTSISSDKFSAELRGQPRKSDLRLRKAAKHFDDDERTHHHAHRSQPTKNLVRAQLRQIERLF